MDLCWQVMSLLFNILSRLVIAFLPRSKHLLISWLQSPSKVILDPKKIKSVTVTTFSHIYFSLLLDKDFCPKCVLKVLYGLPPACTLSPPPAMPPSMRTFFNSQTQFSPFLLGASAQTIFSVWYFLDPCSSLAFNYLLIIKEGLPLCSVFGWVVFFPLYHGTTFIFFRVFSYKLYIQVWCFD